MSSDTLKMLVYGDPGVGKTVFGGSADKAIFIDIEGGSMSIQNRIKAKKVQRKKFETFDEIEQYLVGIRENGTKAETIIIDSVTELQKVLMDNIVAAHPEVRRPYGDGLTVGDWGYNTERMRRFLRMVRDLPYNIIFVCLSMESKNESTGEIATMPKVTDKLSKDLCGYVDIVGYMYTDEESDEDGRTEIVRKMLFQPNGLYYAKDRSGELPVVMDNPTFNEVYTTIFGKQLKGE